MPSETRTSAGARRQVWPSVQDNNSAASRGSAQTVAANSVAGCRAVARHSSDRSRAVTRADWQNRASESRGKEHRRSDWRARIFATASSPKYFDYNPESFGGGGSIARRERGCAVCERGHGFQLASGFIAGSSADPNIECTTPGGCESRQFARRSREQSSHRGKFRTSERDTATLRPESDSFAYQKEARGFDVATPCGFGTCSDGWYYL